jgi:hypothetical protein
VTDAQLTWLASRAGLLVQIVDEVCEEALRRFASHAGPA